MNIEGCTDFGSRRHVGAARSDGTLLKLSPYSVYNTINNV